MNSFLCNSKSLIHIVLIFVQGERQVSSFITLHMDNKLCQHHLLKSLCSCQCMFLAFCPGLDDCRWVAFLRVFPSVPLPSVSVFIPLPCSFVILSSFPLLYSSCVMFCLTLDPGLWSLWIEHSETVPPLYCSSQLFWLEWWKRWLKSYWMPSLFMLEF